MNKTPFFTEHRIPRGQGNLYTRDYEGVGPAFVLMHGFPDNLHIYDELVPYLVAAGRRVVTFDFLGFGRSDKLPDSVYDFAQQLGDLEAVVDGLALDRIVAVAHDAAGPAAVNLAIARADRVAALCLMNTFFGPVPGMRVPELVELFATPSLQALALAIASDPTQLGWLLRFQQKIFVDALPEGQRAHFAESIVPIITDNFLREPTSGPAFARMTSDLFAEVTRNAGRLTAMEALDIPVKLIWGDYDPYLGADLARDFQSHLKNASLHLLSAGHWPQIDTPDLVAKEMLS